MPTYPLVCEACGHEMNVVHSIHEANPRKCPKCRKLKLTRDWAKGLPAFHQQGYSPMHPRANRGRGY